MANQWLYLPHIMPDFAQRNTQEEVMDDFSLTDEYIHPALRELDTINALLGGYAVFYSAFRHIDIPRAAHVCDWGCGGGDTLIRLAHWSRKNGSDLRLSGVDATPSAVAYARHSTAAFPEITIRQGDVFDEHERCDVLISSLFTHHFDDPNWIRLVRKMQSSARIAVIVNDLHRHPLAWWSIRLLTRIFSRSYMVRNDAPLSVLRGFRRKELVALLAKAGIRHYTLRWMWAFRWQLIIYPAAKT